MSLLLRLVPILLLILAACGDDDGVINPDAGQDASVDAPTPDSSTDAAVDVPGVDAVVLDAGSGPSIIDITDSMMDPRQSFAVGFVGDGRVIFAGGFGGTNTPSETWAFDPSTTTWAQLADLPAPHIGARSIVLPDGRMLISGGVPGQFARESNDGIFIFDLDTSTWSPAGTMTERRGGHSVHLLTRGPDAGKLVMFAGGERTETGATLSTTFELYDIATGESTLLATELPSPRGGHSSYDMADGRIAILGGFTELGNPSESAIDEILIYDPMDHSVTLQTETLPEAQLLGFGGALPDGRVLVFPGRYSSNTIRLMDLDGFEFTDVGMLPDGLTSYGLALVPSGIVYLFGGRLDDVSHTDINQYDPVANEWSVIPDLLPQALASIRPTPLPDGRVILMGGQTDLGFIVGETNLFTP